jgi:ribosomal protein L33
MKPIRLSCQAVAKARYCSKKNKKDETLLRNINKLTRQTVSTAEYQ